MPTPGVAAPARALHSPLAWRLFDTLGGVWRRSRVAGIHLTGIPEALQARSEPILVVANHVGWWDGFLVREIHRRLRPEGPFFTVMLEEQLRRYPFLRLLGGIGFVPGSTASLRGLLRTLEQEGRRSPAPLVLFFPQGRLWPSHRRPLGFKGGLRAIRRSLGGSWVVPLAIHLAPGSRPGLEAWMSAAPAVGPDDPEGGDPVAMEARVTRELDNVLHFLARWGEEAPARWPRDNRRLSPAEGLPIPLPIALEAP